MLKKKDFWSLIETAKIRNTGNLENDLLFTLKDLQKEDLISFHTWFQYYIELATTEKVLLGAMLRAEAEFTEEMFHIFINWLIAQGENTYRTIVNEPDTLVYLNEMGIATELWYTPIEILEKKYNIDPFKILDGDLSKYEENLPKTTTPDLDMHKLSFLDEFDDFKSKKVEKWCPKLYTRTKDSWFYNNITEHRAWFVNPLNM